MRNPKKRRQEKHTTKLKYKEIAWIKINEDTSYCLPLNTAIENNLSVERIGIRTVQRSSKFTTAKVFTFDNLKSLETGDLVTLPSSRLYKPYEYNLKEFIK